MLVWLIPSHTSSFRHIYNENKLCIYVLRSTTSTPLQLYISVVATLRHISTFSPTLSHFHQNFLLRIHIYIYNYSLYLLYACTYDYTCAVEAQRHIAFQPSHTCQHDVFVLGSGSCSDTEKQGKAPWAVGRTRTWYALANNTPMRRDTQLACRPDPCCAHVGRHATWICLIRFARLATSSV